MGRFENGTRSAPVPAYLRLSCFVAQLHHHAAAQPVSKIIPAHNNRHGTARHNPAQHSQLSRHPKIPATQEEQALRLLLLFRAFVSAQQQNSCQR
jgi:hypothetical protein